MPGRCSGCSSSTRRCGTTPARPGGPGWPPTCARWTTRWTAGCASGSVPRRRSCRECSARWTPTSCTSRATSPPTATSATMPWSRRCPTGSRGSRPARRTPWRRGRSRTGRAIPTRCSRRTARRGGRTAGTTRSAPRRSIDWVQADGDERVDDDARRGAAGRARRDADTRRGRCPAAVREVPRARPRRVRRPTRRPRRRPHVADVAVPQARGDPPAPAPRADGRLARQGSAHLRVRARLARLLRRRAPPQPEVGLGGPAAASRA